MIREKMIQKGYMLTGVLLGANGTIMGRQRRRMLKQHRDSDEAQEV